MNASEVRTAQHALTFKRGANGVVFIPEVKHARGALYPISVRVRAPEAHPRA